MVEQSLRRNGQFALFSAGQLTSNAGSFLLALAVLLHVFAATHSTRWTTLAFLAESAPPVFVSPWAGAIADRLDRRRILICADLARAALLLPLLLTSNLGVLVASIAVQSAVGAVFRPTQRAFLPSLVPPDQLASANSLTSTTVSVVQLLGPFAGAALFAAAGFNAVVLVDACTFLVSVVTLWFLRPAYAVPRQREAVTSVRADVVEGARLLNAVPAFRVILATAVGLAVLEAFLTPVVVPFFEGVLHVSPTLIGVVASAQGASTLAVGLALSVFGKRLSPARMYVVGAAGLPLLALALALAPSYAVALLVLIFLAVPVVLFTTGETTLIQLHVPDQLLGRAMGFFEATLGLSTVVGAAGPAFLVGVLGVRGILVAGAAVSFAGGVVAIAGYRRIVATPSIASQVDHRLVPDSVQVVPGS
jgi:predicted MFS family arabinose efflux permease